MSLRRAAVYAVAVVAWLLLGFPFDGPPGLVALLVIGLAVRGIYVAVLRLAKRPRPLFSPWVFWLAAIFGVLTIAGQNANAATPAGFYESRVLEPAASFVAGKHARVLCGLTVADWRTYAGRNGTLEADALTLVGSDQTELHPAICQVLRRQLRKQEVDRFDLAASILVLTHESIHQRGVADEGETECQAMHEMPRVAVRFFGVKTGRQLRALMAQAWQSHRQKPAAFQTVC